MSNAKDFEGALGAELWRQGIEIEVIDCQRMLRAGNADEYEIRVRRADDAVWHWMPIRIRGFDLTRTVFRSFAVARTAQRACRWLRLPYMPEVCPIRPEVLKLWQEELDAAQEFAERQMELHYYGDKK